MAKKALVVKEPFLGRNINDIERIVDVAEIDFLIGTPYEPFDKVDVPVALESIDIKDLKAVDIPDTWTQSGQTDVTTQPTFSVDTWIKSGAADVTTDPNDNTYSFYASGSPDPRWTFVPAHKEIQQKVDADYSASEKLLKEGATLATGVYSDLANTFSTQKPEVATAWYLTAMAMSNDPAFFAGAGLEAEIPSTSFPVGTALDTAQKVTDYSNEILAAAKQYALDRMLKYKTYRNKKTSLGF